MQERPKIAPQKILPKQTEYQPINEIKTVDYMKENDTRADNNISQDKVIKYNHQIESSITKPRPKLGDAKYKGNGIIQSDMRETLEINKIQPKLQKKRKLKFEDKYHRLSTFLENGLYDTVIELKEQGYIESIVQLVNDAIKQYLNINHNEEKSDDDNKK